MSRSLQSHLAVGQIAGAHGVRGEMKVLVMTDFAERFAPGSLLWIEGEDAPRAIVATRPHKGFLLVRMAGLETRTAVEPLRRRYLLIERSRAAALPDDEYYEDELVGLQVVAESGQHLGELTEILWTGANEVYVVQGAWGEILLPAIADVVQEVDLAQERMVVRLMPGLVPALDDEAGAGE